MKNLILPFLLSLAFLTQAQTPDTAAIRVEIDSLIQLNRSLVKEQKYDEAHQVIQQAEEKCLAAFGEETALYGTVVFNKGKTFYYQRDMPNAEQFYILSKNIREQTIGKEHADYTQSLYNLGILYKRMMQYEKAEPLYLEAKAIAEMVLGKEHNNYVRGLFNLGSLYMIMGQYEKAEPFYLEAKVIAEKVLGKEHRNYATILGDLGLLYRSMGQYEKAELFSLEAKVIWDKVSGKEHPSYASSLHNLGTLYWRMGQYEKAEALYLEAKAIKEKVLGKEHPSYATSLNNLGILYMDMGQYEKAEPFYLEAKVIAEKVLGKEHIHNVRNLENLGILYMNMEQYEKAEPFILQAIVILEKVSGKEHPSYASSLHNLGTLYMNMGQYEKAEPLYLEAKAIKEKVLGKEHPSYATSLNNLGVLYKYMGQYEKAEPFYLEVKAIREKVLSKEHPHYAEGLFNLGSLYWSMGQYEKAEPFYLEASDISKVLILKASRHLSERELLTYTNTFISNLNQLLSFANRQEAVAGSAYDNSLFHKGFLLNATQQVNRLAQTDSTSNELFLRLKSYNRRLAADYSKPVAERDSSTIADLEEKANTVEKELTQSVAGFGEALRQVSWQEVQQELKADEVAMEFVHYRYSEKEQTDSTLYAVLLLKAGNSEPLFIPLFEEKSLDSLLALHQARRSDYVNDLYSFEERGLIVVEKPKKTLYELIWQPLEGQLVGVKKIHFSPTGLLHRINLGAISVSDEESLADRFQFIQVNSTRSLVIPQQIAKPQANAQLYGGVQYEMDSLSNSLANTEYLENNAIASRGNQSFNNTDTTLRGGNWNYLKWTEKEVADIAILLSESGIKADTRSGFAATEESFRRIGEKKPSPQILHLATHGFFFPDPKDTSRRSAFNKQEPVFKLSEHPMIRSGLILAGGNHAWQGKPSPKGMEDGTLTAYEISQMDLSSTELVVLSACETGLGDIEGNEGVYGLQRAFKIAGAKYLIMSLWQVPDRQTKDFMVTFYKHWLKDEMTIPDAFRKTQREMKKRFYDPYNWAGFVLVE